MRIAKRKNQNIIPNQKENFKEAILLDKNHILNTHNMLINNNNKSEEENKAE
jgi:hypothetical protein